MEQIKEAAIYHPKFGVNGSDKFLAIIYKNNEVYESEYFNTEEQAVKFIYKHLNINTYGLIK